jgi:threonine-phosphate decarboxylase
MRKLAIPVPPSAGRFRHGGAPAGGGPVLDFSASVNPLGPPASVLRALRRALAFVCRYPDPGCTELTARLAALHGVAPEQIVVGNGSSELIHVLPRALGARRAAIVEPTYTEYLHASQLAGAEVGHWLPDGEDFTPGPFDPGGADLVWLGNPNNPTGYLWDVARLLGWIRTCPRTVFAVDEAFLPFETREASLSLIPHLHRLPNLVVLRSLTKVYALPGLRLGYAVAHPEIAGRLRRQLVPWSVNVLAQAAGLAALEDDGFLDRTHAWARAERAFLGGRLAGLPYLRPLASSTIFVLVRLHGGTAARLTAALRERGLLIRDASNFVGLDGRYVRISLRSPEDNRRLVEELAGCAAEVCG